MVAMNDKSKTQPLNVIFQTDLKRPITDNSVKTVENKKTKISNPNIENNSAVECAIKRIQTVCLEAESAKALASKKTKLSDSNLLNISTIPSSIQFKSAVDCAAKQIEPVRPEVVSKAKRRKTQSTDKKIPVRLEAVSDAQKRETQSTDKWIGANDILRLILIENAKNERSLTTNTALPVPTGTISTGNTSARVSNATVYSPISNSENSKNIINTTTTAKDFRFEDLYGVSDDSE